MKTKLLIVSAISPFPKTSGGAVRIFNTIKYLRKQYDIYFIFFKEVNYVLSNEDKQFLKNHTILHIDINQNNKKASLSFLNNFQPYWFSEWHSAKLKLLLPRIINQYNIKLCQIDCTQLLYLINYISKNTKTIFCAYDICTVSFWRRLFEIRNPLRFIVHFIRWVEIYLYEKYYLSKYNRVIIVSEIDKNFIKKIFNISQSITLKNGLDSINFLKKTVNKEVIHLGYIGSFNHSPNRKAVYYFLTQIAPVLNTKDINYKYYLAGDISRDELSLILNQTSKETKNRLIIMGKIKSVIDFYKEIDILIAPIFSGSGTRIKIIESLGYGIPVISTKIGAEGIFIKNNLFKIADTVYDFVYDIQYFKSMKKSNTINNQVQLAIILQDYLWKNIFSSYNQKLGL